jgi:putative ABC transport system ATP-binding protein
MYQKPLVSIKYLNHYFGHRSLRRRVLSNINLEVHPREIIILSGPSGSGKTTLLTLVGGLRSVCEGSLKVFDQEVRGASDVQLIKIRRHIGYIFQAHNLLRSLTARQNVQMSIQLNEDVSSQEARIKSEAALEAVGLGHRVNYYPENLSGGQNSESLLRVL